MSDKIAVDVYLDATSSMKGFVETGSPSYYQRLLPLLESAATEGWKTSQVSFNKFGTNIEPLADRGYLTARDPKFYTLSKEGNKTYLQKIIDSAEPSHLSVIVTDLFQDNSDVNQIAGKIKERFISQNLAVGVYALKSQFKGTVYDIGPGNATLTYASQPNDDNSMRPFYLLVLGSHTDVANYFTQLEQSEMKNFPVKAAIIFSPYLGKPEIAFRDAEVSDNTKVSDITGRLSGTNPNSELFKDFYLAGKPASAAFTVKYNYEVLPFTIGFNPEIKAEAAPMTCSGTSETSNNRALQIKNVVFNQTGNKAAVEFTAELNPSEIPDKGLYPYKITLFPQEFTLPGWANEWDMDISQIDKWKQSPGSFEGFKTYNLKNFLNTLWRTTQQFQKPVLSEQYVIFSRS